MKKVLTILLIMGLFSKLFAQTDKKNLNSSVDQELRLKYNIMTNISLEKCQKYVDREQFKLIENGIYQDLTDSDETKYRMTISYKLDEENDTNNQYPIEDILNKYYLYVYDFLESENSIGQNIYKLELAGALEDLKKSQEIIGKKVYNAEFRDEKKTIRVDLIIE